MWGKKLKKRLVALEEECQTLRQNLRTTNGRVRDLEGNIREMWDITHRLQALLDWLDVKAVKEASRPAKWTIIDKGDTDENSA